MKSLVSTISAVSLLLIAPGAALGSPHPALQRMYDRDASTVLALIRLICEFEPVLQAHGVDMIAARRRFAAVSVSRDHWAYQAIDRLQNTPLVIGYGRETRPALTRLALAEATAVFLVQEVSEPSAEPPNPDRLLLLARLVNTFESELRLLGVDVAAEKSRLTAAETSVLRKTDSEKEGRDSAMEILHRAGIIIGYPATGKASGAKADKGKKP
ncbi:MAG: hypothetical protein V4671_10215 [Armatimonadota bacterium]